MKQFDIFSWQPAGWPEPHPCVIVSHPDRAGPKDTGGSHHVLKQTGQAEG
jgi:hypothetical protein